MKTFIKQTLLFFLGFLLLFIAGIMIPPTPRASTSHIFSKLDKDKLLATATSPRLILIGGSNVSLSINSQILKDSLGYNPINTGISASIGLAYMLDNTLEYIRPGDIVIVSPEYSQFYDYLAYGTEDLVRTVLDVAPSEVFDLRRRQLRQMIRHIPRYCLTKFKPAEYTFKRDPCQVNVYERWSYNEYGDLFRHWGLGQQEFPELKPLGAYDPTVIKLLHKYQNKVAEKGGSCYITFPAISETSFKNQISGIRTVEKELRENGFTLLGNPSRYKMPGKLMFDTPYHLTKEGVDHRTQMLVRDIKKTLLADSKNSSLRDRYANNDKN